MLRKFLMIGLGGSGGKTLRYLKQILEERLEEIGWDEGMPEGWQFLHIDTPAAQDSPVLPGSPALLDADEYLSLTSPGIDFKTIVDHLQDKGEDFAGWLVDRMKIPIAMGAGQYRAVGRIIGLFYTNQIKKGLLGKQSALMSAGAAAQLDRLAHRIAGGQVSAEAMPPVAIVISSLAGGTGAGILTDVCDILRANGDEVLDKPIGILYSADVFAELPKAAGTGIQPNTAAAVAELLHGYFGDGSFVPPGGGAIQQWSGPAFPYLVGHANIKGVNFGDQVDVYRFMARCLSAVMSDRRIQDDFTQYMTTNWQESAGKFAGKPGPWMLPGPSYQGTLQALGFAEVDLGVGRLHTYAEQRITRDAVEWLLDGHRVAASERPEYENATPQEVVEDLADRSLTRFLNDCGLNERGREQHQILDAISVPDDELRAECTRVAGEVHNVCRERFGSKASTSEWADLIVEDIEARQASVLERLKERIRDACLKWVEEIPDRILGVLGETLAEQGALVALKLLDKTDAEMERVKGELRAEQHKELTRVDYDLRSGVTDAIGPLRGRLNAENKLVDKAISSAVQIGIVRHYNAEHRKLGSRLAEDLRNGLLEPLARALRDAVGELRIAVDTDRNEAGSALIRGWPRHDPPAEQVVPDALKPGKSVKLVIDPDTFPGLFDELTVRSTGLEEKVEAYRSVRKKAIAGAPDRPATERWIITDAKWAAREWLTVDAPPGPASFTVMIKRDHLMERSRAWLNTDGAWKDFLSQGLREYLSDRLPAAERVPREERFRSALAAAFEAAEPLVSVDREMLLDVHPELGLDRPRHNTSPIPVAGLPVAESVREFLVKHFQDTHDKPQEEAEKALDQSERETRVAVYTSLGGALHPMVFKSLNKPIAEAWASSKIAFNLHAFWKARRSCLLWRATPIPRPMLQAMVRGWFIGRVLNLIEIRGGEATFTTEGSPFGFEAMLPVLGHRPVDFLAALLEALPLAIPVVANNRQPEYLRPYTQMIEWGSEPGTVDADTFLRPSRVLEVWLEHGTTPGGRPPVVEGPDRPARRKAAAGLLRREADSYRRQAEADRSRDCTPKNAWLGVAEIISRALSEIVRCLESDEMVGPTL